MYSPEAANKIIQNLQYLCDIRFINNNIAEQILMQVVSGMGSVSMLMNQYCSNYGMWLNNNLIPPRPTTFNNYGAPNTLHLSREDITQTVHNYLLSNGYNITEVKKVTTVMYKHACPNAGIIRLDPMYLCINTITALRCVIYYYCPHCGKLYVLDDTMTPIGVSIPYEVYFRKAITVNYINAEYEKMKLLSNRRYFSMTADKYMNNEMLLQSVEPALYNIQLHGIVNNAQLQEMRTLILYGNSVKKVFDTFCADYTDKLNNSCLPYRRTRFDNEGNALEVNYTMPEKIIGIANNIALQRLPPVRTVVKLFESTKRHACVAQGVIPTNIKDVYIYNGIERERQLINYCDKCGKLMYIDGENIGDTIDDTPDSID